MKKAYEILEKILDERDRALWLMLTDNSKESIHLYCVLVEKKIPVMLVEKSTSQKKIQQIIHEFQPAYLLMPKEGWDLFPFLKLEQGKGYGHYEVWKNNESKVWKNQNIEPQVAVLLSTSGTTGSGKFVILTYENLESNTDSIIESLNMTEKDRVAVMLPISYSYGLSVVNSTLKAGGTLLFPKGMMMQKSFWEYLEEEKVTMLSGVPYTYEVIKRMRILERPLRDLRILTQAGGAMSLSMKQYLLEEVERRKRKGQEVELAIMYGQTEATARMSSFFLNRYPHKINSVGQAISGGKFTIKAPDSEGKGEILYQGRNISWGYAWSWRDLTEEVLGVKKRNGCLYTGDIGSLDEEGFLYVTGRKSRFVKVRGYRISLDELQKELSQELKSQVVCVNGLDENADKIGVGIVDKGLLEESTRESTGKERCREGKQLLTELEQILSRKRIQRQEYHMRIMEALPRRSNGKIDYRELQKKIFGK